MAPDPADLPPTVTLANLRRRFGRGEMGYGRFCKYMQKMVEQAGFPKPLPTMSTQRKALFTEVTENSCWVRVAVDAWFDDFMPPAIAGKLDDAARRAAAAEMDASARRLHLVSGRGQ